MNCKNCNQTFEINPQDLSFYEKAEFPKPTLCPEDRQRRRIVWRNERFLYRGICDACNKKIITMYPPERKFPILCPECFWSDRFEPEKYAQEFDLEKPFFEQFAKLYEKVPQLSIFQGLCVNSQYTLNNFHNKNCYMLSGADYNEDCMYGLNTQRSKDCVDHILIYDSQLCYGCLWSANLYNCVECQDCENVSDSFFLYDCKGCASCALSSNLRNKQYVLFNEQLTKEIYEKKLLEIFRGIFESPFWLYENLAKVKEKAIQQATVMINTENASGNYIRSSKNAHDVFDAENLEDCGNCYYALSMKNSYDASCVRIMVGWGRTMYECISTVHTESVFFSSAVIESHNVYYSRCIWNCSDLFACTSLKNHKRYLIFNKQYSKEEYLSVVKKIIEHMKRTGEFGEFFPPSLSPFEYKCLNQFFIVLNVPHLS